MDDPVILYGRQRPAGVVEHLEAGPVRLKFQDGELRYLRVGGREIVRRVYFAVRDRRWDTVMPAFERVEVNRHDGGFTIDLSARCANDVAEYAWTARIEGTGAGKITFAVRGEAPKAFRSPRVGLCVLFGAEALAAQRYELLDAEGQAEGEFPRAIRSDLLSRRFAGLRYVTADGLAVSCRLAEGSFGMEDQRNFGDSSYKAFSGMAYAFPDVPAGVAQVDDVEDVAAVNGEYFGEIRPASTIVVVAGLVDPRWKVEVELDAFVED